MFNKIDLCKATGNFSFNSLTIPEKTYYKEKIKIELSMEPLNGKFLEMLQAQLNEMPLEILLTNTLQIPELNFKISDIRILGEYIPGKKNINYYGKHNYKRIVQIHERFHAIHHLTKDPVTNKIWGNFPYVDSYYTELLAQLFTYRYIMDFEPHLEKDFLDLNQNQSFMYKTWIFFKFFNTAKVVKLYWMIRNYSSRAIPIKMLDPVQMQINSKLLNAISFICTNPSIFVSETDIHGLVMRELMTIDELNPSIKLYDTKCTIGTNNGGKASKTMYKTMLVHKEYGHADSPFSRSDIVILNPSDVREIDDPINLKKGNAWLIPDYIFEFGTEKSAGNVDVFRNHIKSDLQKVSKAKKQGYLIHIHRNYYTSAGGRKTKNKEKFADYENCIKTELAAFCRCKTSSQNIPKVIIAVIDLGGTGRAIKKEGKIRILTDPFGKNSRLISVNLKRINVELKNLIA